MAAVLKGVRVIDHSTFITGAAVGQLLGDLGANVIKVERPGEGDPFRAYKGSLYAPHFQAFNRNKRSVTLDTRNEEDLRLFDALVENADVYIQNFRPGTANKLNAGEQRLRGINGKLVYCSISGFGATGPDSDRPVYDTVAQAASGFLSLMVNKRTPGINGPAIADAITGYIATHGVMAALYERNQTGRGRLVEVSMLEAMCYFNIDSFTHFYADGQVMDSSSRPRVSQSYALECADGKWIALHMSSPEKFWSALARLIGSPDILADDRFASRDARIVNYEALRDLLQSVFRRRTRVMWCEGLRTHDVPHSEMYDASEALFTPQAKHLELAATAQGLNGNCFTTVRSALSFDGERCTQITPPPLLGEHSEDIRSRLWG
jgi:crotonobetainyl-CoA:carnitine CoA-transferase CaiB-like acyl-CoA transferase